MIILLWSGFLFFSSPVYGGEGGVFQDFRCRLFGCAILSNGKQYEINILDGVGSVPATPMNSSDSIFPVIAETDRIAAESVKKTSQTYARIGVDQNGDGRPDIRMRDAGETGFLDVGDRFSPFVLDQKVDLAFEEPTVKHSFYITANKPFELAAKLVFFEEQRKIGRGWLPETLEYRLEVTPSGQDGSIRYGAYAEAAGFNCRRQIYSLSDLSGGSSTVASFDKAICTVDVSDILEASLRITNCYRFPKFDLSQPSAFIAFGVEYEIFNK